MSRAAVGASSPALLLKYKKNNYSVSRFGFVVSTKISKKATERNLIKRRLRAIVQKERANIVPGYDIVMLTRPPIRSLSFSALQELVDGGLRRSKLLITQHD